MSETQALNEQSPAPEAHQGPRFIAVEGPIGVGKTSLARRLAETFGYDLLLEKPEENPFLARFYENPRQHALATQLFFLFQRARQIQDMRQEDLFTPVHVTDFLIDKDSLFARQNLDTDEFRIYQQVYDHLTIDAPVPDLVLYLQAPTPVLLNRIQKRGIAAEQQISAEYLERLNTAYTEYFHYFDRAPLLIVNSSEIDLVNNDHDYQQLVDQVLSSPQGTHYFNPAPTLL
ncbi:MAG: deoxynucleoside kinase [Pseudohongiellaceae bacterium]